MSSVKPSLQALGVVYDDEKDDGYDSPDAASSDGSTSSVTLAASSALRNAGGPAACSVGRLSPCMEIQSGDEDHSCEQELNQRSLTAYCDLETGNNNLDKTDHFLSISTIKTKGVTGNLVFSSEGGIIGELSSQRYQPKSALRSPNSKTQSGMEDEDSSSVSMVRPKKKLSVTFHEEVLVVYQDDLDERAQRRYFAEFANRMLKRMSSSFRDTLTIDSAISSVEVEQEEVVVEGEEAKSDEWNDGEACDRGIGINMQGQFGEGDAGMLGEKVEVMAEKEEGGCPTNEEELLDEVDHATTAPYSLKSQEMISYNGQKPELQRFDVSSSVFDSSPAAFPKTSINVDPMPSPLSVHRTPSSQVYNCAIAEYERRIVQPIPSSVPPADMYCALNQQPLPMPAQPTEKPNTRVAISPYDRLTSEPRDSAARCATGPTFIEYVKPQMQRQFHEPPIAKQSAEASYINSAKTRDILDRMDKVRRSKRLSNAPADTTACRCSSMSDYVCTNCLSNYSRQGSLAPSPSTSSLVGHLQQSVAEGYRGFAQNEVVRKEPTRSTQYRPNLVAAKDTDLFGVPCGSPYLTRAPSGAQEAYPQDSRSSTHYSKVHSIQEIIPRPTALTSQQYIAPAPALDRLDSPAQFEQLTHFSAGSKQKLAPNRPVYASTANIYKQLEARLRNPRPARQLVVAANSRAEVGRLAANTQTTKPADNYPELSTEL